jgi:hypothetical protein
MSWRPEGVQGAAFNPHFGRTGTDRLLDSNGGNNAVKEPEDAEIEQRRIKVSQLLQECTDAKLLKGGSSHALEKAIEAHKLATREPDLLTPWPQLTAYRSAHLMLRGRASKADLVEADRLLALATGEGGHAPANLLGPLPRLYRLAVLHRIWLSETSDSARERTRNTLRTVFDRARAEVLTPSAGSPRQTTVSARGPRGGPIQDTGFNLLELAAYFLGEDYSPLEGLGLSDEELHRPSIAWYLVGPDPAICRVSVLERLAVAELEARGQQHCDAILFKLPNHPGEPVWKRASDPGWKRISDDHLRLLAAVLSDPQISPKELKLRVVQVETTDRDAYYRQAVKRLRAGLSQLTGMESDSVLPRDNATGRLVVSPEIRIYGAVDERTLRRRR